VAKQYAEKLSWSKKSDDEGLKPRLIFNGLRGPKGPLFHGSTDKSEFFSKL